MFTVGLIFTMLIPSFNENWSQKTERDGTRYHQTYISRGGALYRQWPDGTQDNVGPTTVREGDIVGYTDLEEVGRRVYQREGCMYCHSQQIRPLNGEMTRYSVGGSLALNSDEREYVFDQPHFLGTRRIGPDLSREGGKYSDDWQYSHFYDPRQMVPGSVMPAFQWLFNIDAQGNVLPNADGRALVAYVQTLGFGRLIHDPSTYPTHGGWGPWIRPKDQQNFQIRGESAVLHAAHGVRAGEPVSVTNTLPSSPLSKPEFRTPDKLKSAVGSHATPLQTKL